MLPHKSFQPVLPRLALSPLLESLLIPYCLLEEPSQQPILGSDAAPNLCSMGLMRELWAPQRTTTIRGSPKEHM